MAKNPQKSNRLSSLFGLSKSESQQSLTPSSSSSTTHNDKRDSTALGSGYPAQLLQSPSHQKLRKDNPSTGPGLPMLNTMASAPLPLPPSFSDDALNRPPSRGSNFSRPGSRQASRDASLSRPTTPSLMAPMGDGSPITRPLTPGSAGQKISKRRSWLPGKSDKGSGGDGKLDPQAWIAGLKEHIAYNTKLLYEGDVVPELWNDTADTFVYLFPEATGYGPSFKVDSFLFTSSQTLRSMSKESGQNGYQNGQYLNSQQMLASQMNSMSLGPQDTFSLQAARPYNAYNGNIAINKHLHLPLEFDGDVSSPNVQLKGDDSELLVLYRNLFAFLMGGALVATPRQATLYPIFMGISTILTRFGFSNVDGSTYGEICSSSFTRYCDELRLADVRSSREKTIEAVVLGERMRSWPLYNEGFVHTAGKLVDVKQIQSPKYNQISPITRNRLERASLDLEGRLRTVRYKLEDFDFPSMFAGIANSQTEPEGKMVRFKAWKSSFINFRKHIIAHYRQRYGAWPPRASSKKNNFEESGLNRIVLKEMYQDFCDLYDMLADRAELTSRTIDMLGGHDAETSDMNESTQHALRRVESEYDRSTPPVQPPIPFDVPLIPSLSASFNRTHVQTAHVLASNANMKERSKRLKDNEVNEILLGSYNRDNIKATPWLEDFLRFERRSGHAKSIDEIADLRCGQWLLLYAILQALPMCVVDARDLRFTEGVEYLLCMPPRGGRPWMKEDTSQSRNWYNVASGGGVVSLPGDMIDHSVEGIYRRSHCWTIAAEWAQTSDAMSPTTQMALGAPLVPPPIVGGRSPRQSPHGSPHLSPHLSPAVRPVSPALSESGLRKNANRSSLAIGLQEAAPPFQQTSRPVSINNPDMTFDSILGNPTQTAAALGLKQEKKDKKKK